ncbi:Flagellar hook-associated protein flgK [Candidatus Nitrotoga sp. HW29]|uniref:flagellar hook-associated protein FlgK n=1 Tax=Candidatus Nitrotoga sp. HW29 TaxID=2886963 RepID=UPI001EF324FC|nr:flagellar hook-associated protein FlgK [Candidatus Nitrotoga sp. HW29]CAH1904224.1 Flagellar hook-associated protein flgK [Candidatus Nitrotoga sp. HW29]
MGIGIFGSGVSALNAAQIGLSTTEHNIANVNTPGFNRQEVVLGTRLAQATGAGFIGQGVNVNSVKRIYNEFLSNQVMQGQAQASQLETYANQIGQINNLLADPDAGLSPALQEFFSAINNVASSPESQAARQSMLGSAESLVSRFQSLNQRMSDINSSINGQITSSVTAINSYAQQIASMNKNIVLAQAAFNGQAPNDLLDQRDQLISQLNQEIKTNVVKQSDGSFNVFIGAGQSLVVGEQVNTLQAVQSLSDPSRIDVAYRSGASVIRLQQNSLQGGNMGGLLAFRNESLDVEQNALGRVAMVLADTFNQQHKLGQDLNGALGGNFFAQPVPAVNSNVANTGNATVSASVVSSAALTGSDYTLRFNGGTAYTLTRLSDNTVTAFATLPQTVDGLTITTTAGAVAGDSYTIRPTVNGARDIAVTISDPSRIAASVPIRTNASLANIGSGRISEGTVDATLPVNANLQQPVSIVFDSPPTTFTVTGVGVPGSPVAGVTYTAGTAITYNGWSMQITGAPVAGDTFTVASNTNAAADNRNALLLASLQTKNTVAGGTASYQGAYAQLVSQVGNKTRELETISSAQTSMVNQLIQTQQSVSGVNLDEEAANLIRYQRAYQAAGKAIQIAGTLFDTLLSLGG